MRRAPLPHPRSVLTGALFDRLASPPHDVGRSAQDLVDRASDDDLHLALYCMYELHYGGFPGVAGDWEWEPSLLALRRTTERRFESELTAAVGPVRADARDAVRQLWELAGRADGPSLSGWVSEHATLVHVTELFKHRSAYQLKEADPHTWAIPRLAGPAKAVMTAIQTDEYGAGRAAEMHSALFARTMDAVGLDPTPNRYLDEIPGFTLATTNLISMLGLHGRRRGALVGHLALFEMTSTGPMGRYSRALRRLGLAAPARRFFDVHVEADEVHQHLATDGMVAGLLSEDPDMATDVLFGARCLQAVEGRFTAGLLACWQSGRSSLLTPAGTDAGRPAA